MTLVLVVTLSDLVIGVKELGIFVDRVSGEDADDEDARLQRALRAHGHTAARVVEGRIYGIQDRASA